MFTVTVAEAESVVWPRPLSALAHPGWSGVGSYKLLSVGLVVAVVIVYVIFS